MNRPVEGFVTTLTTYGIGVLLFAHGWVHFVYIASSRDWFGPEATWAWNGESWLLSGVLGRRWILDFASGLFLLVAVGFAVGAIGYVLGHPWNEPLLVSSAGLSTVGYVLLWDGEFTQLLAKGVVGIVINLGILGWVFG